MPIKIGQRPDHGFDQPLGLLSDCHRRIEHFLQVLIAIGHGAAGGPLTAGQRAELEGSLTYFTTAALQHTADEEESLFPRLRASNHPAALLAIGVLERLEHDHEDMSRHHGVVDILVRRWLTNASLSPTDIGELRERLTTLEAIYRRHIAIEDDELFPAGGRVLTPDQVHEIGREMAARRARAAVISSHGRRSG